MNGVTSIDLSRRLKAQGFDQDQWPQMVHVAYNLIGPRGSDPEGGFWNSEYAANDSLLSSDPEIGEWCAAPVLLSGDPERPGVVEWLESKGWHFIMTKGKWRWSAWGPLSTGVYSHNHDAGTLPELIDLILTAMEASDAVP